jgi:hypothetical protein
MCSKDVRRNKAWVTTAVVPVVLGLALAIPGAASAQDPQNERVVVNQPVDTAQQPQLQHPTPAPTGIVQQGAWTISPVIGAGMAADFDGAALALGVGAAYNWTPRVSFEGELGYARTSFGNIQPLNTNFTTASVNALYHFGAGNFAPYGTVGLGLGHANRGAHPNDAALANASRTGAMFNWGGGVKAPIGDRTNLRVGIRHFTGHDLVPNYWRPYVGVTFNMGTPVW